MTTSLTMKSGFLPLYQLRHDERHSQWRVRMRVHMLCQDTLWSAGTDPEIWLEMVAAMSCLHHSTWELDGLGGKTVRNILILKKCNAYSFNCTSTSCNTSVTNYSTLKTTEWST